MNTQHVEPDQSSDQHLSGELHLPHITNTGTRHIVPPAQPEPISSSPGQVTGDSNQNVFYFQDDLSLEEDDADAFHSPLATPFQMSAAMSPIHTSTGRLAQPTPPPSSPPAEQSSRRFPLVRVLILVAVIVIVILTAAMAFAQSPPAPAALPVHTTTASTNTIPTKQQDNGAPKPSQQAKGNTPTARPTNPPAPHPGTTTGQNSGPGSWLPQQFPAGWTNAGLTTGDALFSERTAATFTDREMSLDYRSVGSRTNHEGTFTAATFILTANAKQRFAQNDVRVINNVLFDKVQQEKLIQSVVNAQPQLATFTVIGQQQVAWVDVSFQLWQSKIDATGTRTEGFDTDPATNQPRTHHMMVLLLRVPQDAQGSNPSMGGTGWLVSNYALDLPAGTTLNIAQPA